MSAALVLERVLRMGAEEQSRRWGVGRAEAGGARQRGGVGPRGRDSLGP